MEQKIMAYFETAYYPGICLEGLKKTTKYYPRYPVFGPGFNPRTSLIRSRDANHSAATFNDMCTVSRKNHMLPAIHCLVEAEWFAFLLHIMGIAGSNLYPETDYPGRSDFISFRLGE
jgi:hypothetical protein